MHCSLRGRAEPGPLRLLVGTESVVAQGDVFLKYSFTSMWSHGFVLLSKTLLTKPCALNTPQSATTHVVISHLIKWPLASGKVA